MQNESQEDYLRAIYYIYENNGEKINSVAVADYLGISKAAVSKMLKKIVNQKLIKMRPYSSIVFTAKGLKEVIKLTHKRRIIEVFLVDILGVSKKEMHQEVHKLEHAFSDKTIKKLTVFLNDPKFCPDGKNIPKIIK